VETQDGLEACIRYEAARMRRAAIPATMHCTECVCNNVTKLSRKHGTHRSQHNGKCIMSLAP
jgi:hypothetical protein